MDSLLLQQVVLSAVALLAIAGTAFWVSMSQPGAREPAYFDTDSKPVMASGSSLVSADPESPQSAYPDIRAAAEAGDADAEYRLGLAIVQRSWDRGEQFAFVDAVEWIRKAAEQDHVRAQLVLGALYEKGRGVIQDYQEANNWYRRAAMQGDALAMSRIGLMHMNGRGVERDLVEAYVWLNLAAARGDADAELDRNRVRSLLSAAELAQAQDRSRSFNQDLPRLVDNSRPLPSGF